jgi:two-component system, response regulator
MKDKVILLVEDNPDDADLTIRVLNKANIKNPVVWVENGVEALAYLHGTGSHSGRDISELPQVVLMDLNMPRMAGLDTLRAIREHPVTKLLPVVVLTTSKEEHDIVQAYQYNANSYIRKPVDFVAFSEAMRTLGIYWILMNEIPPPIDQNPVVES